MKLKAVSGIILTLLFVGMLAFGIQPVKASGNIYIRADGSIGTLVLARETDTIANPYMNGTVRTVEPPWTIWTRYHNYSEYPNIVDLFSIGKSWENRDIYCIRLTNESLTDPKPKVFFVGYHHAREPISAELPLYFVVHAATGYGVNATITRMLDFSEIYVIVALNVDGFDAVEVNEWQRKNVHPFDDDGDGLLDEDPPDDDDGDGFIEIKPGGIEGIDDDGDGLLNEDWVGGVDLNRNYGYQWGATGASGSPYPRDEDYRGFGAGNPSNKRSSITTYLQICYKFSLRHGRYRLPVVLHGYNNTRRRAFQRSRRKPVRFGKCSFHTRRSIAEKLRNLGRLDVWQQKHIRFDMRNIHKRERMAV